MDTCTSIIRMCAANKVSKLITGVRAGSSRLQQFQPDPKEDLRKEGSS